jgi:antitoxin ParD1/3/4
MDQTEKLSITVTAQQAEAIRQHVASGAYASASEVVRAGLRALDREREEYERRIESIRAKVEASINDPRPHLTGEEVRERLRLHHEETVKARRKNGTHGG